MYASAYSGVYLTVDAQELRCSGPVGSGQHDSKH